MGPYGLFKLDGRLRMAHRVAYEDIIGPIAPGLVVDHLCRNPACVNPFHLEPVTRQVNARRGNGPRLAAARHRARTHCKHGHAVTPENIYVQSNGKRYCRPCRARLKREWRRRKRNAAASPDSG
jgi:hypothetical protein